MNIQVIFLKLSLLFLLLLHTQTVSSQPNLPKETADSLWAVWVDESKPDTSRLDALDTYTWKGYLQKKPDSALYFAKIQYDFAKKKNLKKEMAYALNTQGASWRLRGNYNNALLAYEKSLKIREELNDTQGISNILNNMGIIHYYLGNYTHALQLYSRSQTLMYDLGIENQPEQLLNMGLIYMHKGYYDKAYSNFYTSYKMFKSNNRKVAEVITLNNLGLLYKKKGDFSLALEYYSKSLELSLEMENERYIGLALNNIGIVYKSQGNLDKALDYYFESLELNKKINNISGTNRALSNIGTIYSLHKQYSKALDYFNEALEIDLEMNDKSNIATSFNNIGNIHISRGNYDEGYKYIQKSLNLRREVGSLSSISTSLHNLGKIMFEKNGQVSGIDTCKEALKIAHNISDRQNIKSISRFLYTSHLSINNQDSALIYLNQLKQTNDIDLSVNFFVLSEKEKELYFSSMEKDYTLLYDYTLHNGNKFYNLKDTSFNLALMIKGLTLKSSNSVRTAIRKSGDSTLINDYENWLDLKNKIANTSETDTTYKDLVNKANEMESKLVKTSNVFSDFDKVRNLKWQDVQAGLKNNEAAIEFVHFKSEIDTANPIIYAALIVKKDSEHPEMVKLCYEEDLKEILGTFQGNNLNFVNSVYGNKEKAQTALYEKVWKPMEKQLEGVENIYLSPSGLLHKVAFSAIAQGQNTYLCDAYNIRQQNSTGKVALPDEVAFNNDQKFFMMGGVEYNTDSTANEVWSYLPGTLEETKNIKSFLEKKKFIVTHLTSKEAGEESFKTKAPEANILHIATHGFFFPDPEQVRASLKENEEYHEDLAFRGNNINPEKMQRSTRYADWTFVKNQNPLMRSGITLANANDVWQRPSLAEGEDGILTAQEVSTLNLRNTNLVVLSACETGLGDIKGSEGVYGLQRAFKMAGAKYLIMSLWQVPDKETSEFMQLFYKNLVKVKDIPKAFDQTQKAMRKKYDPYYWAAFVLVE